jgi:NUMOD4 motif/HNH endonuclease
MEIWESVKGFENYEVSNLGSVKSLDHFCENRLGSGKQTGRVLKQQKCKKGYLRVSLSKNKKRFSTGAHRLVALAFIPNPENKPQVNHKKGMKTDNRVENLEWCTNQENQIHAIKNNLCNPNLADKHYNAKLTNEQVKTARRMHELGWDNITLSKHYNISQTAMSKILRKLTYINI